MAEKINYSEEQKKIIYSDEKTLLVSASAGSGKTKVLVERIVDLVVNKNISLKNMLVVTFTKLASLEMKSRLKQELEKKEKTPVVLNQLEQLSTANISTLHKFCEVVIKEFFYEAQVDPNFSLLEGAEEKYYKNIALDNVIKRYAEKDDVDFENIFEIFYESRSDESFKNNIFSIYTFLLAKSSDYFENTLKNIYNTDIQNNTAVQYIIAETKECLQSFKEKFEKLQIDAEAANHPKLIEVANQNLDRINNLIACDYFNFANLYKNTKFDSVSGNMKLTEEQAEVRKKQTEVRNSCKDILDKLIECYPLSKEIMEKDFDASKKIVQKFCEVVKEFEKEYSMLKIQMNKLDFNDLEKYIIRILNNKSIRENLQERYKYIFVDEYQDVNAVQEEIISLLTKDNFVFMVGDIKQSIYMFRECNPQIFINKSEKLLGENSEQVVLLNKNYRSDKNILEFNNFVFNKIMTKDTAKLDYQNTSKLVFGETFKEQYLDEPKVNICLIKAKEKDDEKQSPEKIYSVLDDTFELDSEKEIQRQAYLIAEKIKWLVENKEIYDKDLDTNRKIQFKDIAILTRTGETTKQIANVLSELKIPINSEYKVKLFLSSEVEMLVNFLRVINNYQDDIALACTLKSLLYGFSDYDLVKIKQKSDTAFFYKNVVEYLNENDELSKRLKAVFDDISYFKRYIMQNSISACIIEIVNKLGLKEKLYMFDDYCEKLENINNFIKTVAEIDNYNLSSLVDYLENFNRDYDQVVTIKNGDNSVYIGTIHSSKGLEYPVVFVADMSKAFSDKSVREKLIKNNEFGFAMDIYDTQNRIHSKSITKSIFKFKIREQEWQEQLRLLYVAMTRAQCYLYLVASYNKPDFEQATNNFDIKNLNNYLDLIMAVFPQTVLNQVNDGKQEISFDYNKSVFKIENYIDYCFTEEDDKKQSKSQVSQAFEDEFLDYSSKKFEHNNLSFKNTVTALYEMDEENNYNIEDFKLSTRPKGDDDFLLIGTQYHKVMEMLNFDKPFENQFEEIVKTENLDTNLLDRQKIEKAYSAIKELIDVGDTVFREKQFMFYPKLNDVINSNISDRVLIQGMVDLFIIKPNEIVLVDYKTSRIKDEQDMIKKYKLQFDLYASAIEKFYKKKVSKKIIYSFYADRVIIV